MNELNLKIKKLIELLSVGASCRYLSRYGKVYNYVKRADGRLFLKDSSGGGLVVDASEFYKAHELSKKGLIENLLSELYKECLISN